MFPSDTKVRVAVIFDGTGGIKPVWFEAQGQQVRIEKVCYRWSYMEGAATILNFAVWDGEQAWELAYNVKAGRWMLREKMGSGVAINL